MNSLQTLALLMTIGIIVVGIASRMRISYPIALVVGGCVLGFIPGLDIIEFDPNLVLVTVLPPILFYGAYSIPYKDFRRYLRDILWLALGLVIVTTLAIGLLFKWLLPDLPWALAFTFAALISPPDAIAAMPILKQSTINSRTLAVLEGESLINDATGLVLYRIGVVALLTGTFSLSSASLEFVKVVVGGVGIGAVCGYLFNKFSMRFFDPVMAVVFSFTIPYLTYFMADSVEVSGVLAVVVCGLIGSRLLIKHFSSMTRVVGWISWDIVIILLNCFVFVLIGLQLHGLVQRLTVETSLTYALYGVLFTVALIVVRFVNIFIRVGIKFFITQRKSESGRSALIRALILSWSGMRGIVSLTAALALPFNRLDGTPIPGRDSVIFLTFVVILLTLLIPGLTLSSLLKWLKIPSVSEEYDTVFIRKELLEAAQEEIERLRYTHQLDDAEYSFLLAYFHSRHQIQEIASNPKLRAHTIESARKQVLAKKRQILLELWERDKLSDHLFARFEQELDLEESHAARAEI